MTKAERLAAKIQQSKETIEKQRKALAESEAALREETRQATNKRRYQVGALAEEAGLFVWTNTELVDAFTALARGRERERQLAITEAILSDPQRFTEGSNGVAESATRVSAAH
jgi:hypothetical protein